MLELLVATALTSLSPQQRADFACLRVASTMAALHPGAPRQPPWVQRSLRRLQRSDAARDWTAEATPLPETLTYGDFMKWVDICQPGAMSPAKRAGDGKP